MVGIGVLNEVASEGISRRVRFVIGRNKSSGCIEFDRPFVERTLHIAVETTSYDGLDSTVVCNG